MAKRGRKSAAELSVVQQEAAVGARRLAPPIAMSPAEKAVWVSVINDQPADAFGDTHAPLLELFCGHIIKARILHEKIQTMPADTLDTDEGVKRYDKLLAMAEREGRAASSLATRLRITRQAVDQQTIARAQINHKSKSELWQFDG